MPEKKGGANQEREESCVKEVTLSHSLTRCSIHLDQHHRFQEFITRERKVGEKKREGIDEKYN